MEKEYFFSGYCRQLDGARTVEVMAEDGTVTVIDCCFGNCIYETSCPIAKEISEIR